MAKYIKYELQELREDKFLEDINQIKRAGFTGVVIPAARQPSDNSINDINSEFLPLKKIVELTYKIGLEIIIDIDVFQSSYIWAHKNFSEPVNYNNSPYYQKKNDQYYPICPNNPLSEKRLENLLEILKQLPSATTFLFSELSFPFNWKANDLDVQHSQPPFCYCPFCMGEFSEYINEAISEPEQIKDNIRYWMDWRINVIYGYYMDISSKLPANDLIISIPPLSLIDIPFVTGQIPIAFLKENARISMPLLHHTKNKNFNWVFDQLRHYDLEMEEYDLVPIFEISSEDMKNIEDMDKKDFKDIIYYSWDKYYNQILVHP
ncbi:MAG: hypothetical protein K9M80_01700 [Candidatus Marinimicrobia bacterium]|nr:hypothetical protein [Candidatus Neomarinimicrobiota bacterium]